MDSLDPETVNAIVAWREFLGWCLVVNLGLLIFSTIMIVAAMGWISSIHSKLFGLNESTLAQSYFNYLAHFKFLVIVFNFTPWVVLHILV